MAQRLTRRARGTVAALALGLALLPACGAGPETSPMTNSSASPAPANAAENAALSARFAEQLKGMDELALPDEWYQTTGATLAEHFAAVARARRAKDAAAPDGAQLMQGFANHGRPFVHRVWFNRPLRCRKCTEMRGDGLTTVVSVAHGRSVALTEGEIHDVVAHGGSFPPASLAALTVILAPN
jgi:hypothetical protein